MRTCLALSAIATSASVALAGPTIQQKIDEVFARSSDTRGAAGVSTGFEPAEGYALGSANGQQGWNAPTASIIDASSIPGFGSQALEVYTPAAGLSTASLDLTPSFGTLSFDLSIETSPARGGNFNAAVIVGGVSDDAVHVLRINFDGSNVLLVATNAASSVFIGNYPENTPFRVSLQNLGDGKQRVFIDGNNVLDVPSLGVVMGGGDTETNFIQFLGEQSRLTVDNLEFAPAESCNADINDDGAVNAGDLAELLAGWGDCP